MEFVKFCAFIACLLGLAIATHRWSVKKGYPHTTGWTVGILRACTIILVLSACFYAVTGKMLYEKQEVVKSYDDPFKKEHELAQKIAKTEVAKLAKRKAIPDVNIQTILSNASDTWADQKQSHLQQTAFIDKSYYATLHATLFN